MNLEYNEDPDIIYSSLMRVTESCVHQHIALLNKARFLYQNSEQKNYYYQRVCEKLLDELDNNAFGIQWVNKDFFDIRSEEGKSFLINLFNRMKVNEEKKEFAKNELDYFTLRFKLISFIKKELGASKHLNIEEQYELLFRDKRLVRVVDDRLERNEYARGKFFVGETTIASERYGFCKSLEPLFRENTSQSYYTSIVFDRFNIDKPSSFKKYASTPPPEKYIEPFRRIFSDLYPG
jgi:hypothetical protein